MPKKKVAKKSTAPAKTKSAPTTDPKILNATIEALCKKHGAGAIMRLTGKAIATGIDVVPTGSPSLDRALGVMGLPRGRVVEIYGNEAGGKTTLTLHAIAECQKQGGIAAFIDAEHALDPQYAAALGVKVEELLISQPDNGEQALEIADTLARSGVVQMIVIDSVSALVPKAELEGDMGDTHVGLQARMMSQALRKLCSVAHQSNTLIIFINQIRHKIGVMFGCFHYSTRVTLADGTQEKIGKIVNQKMDVEVMSFDPKTGEVRPQRVIGWHDNGKTEEFLAFTCTSNHGGNGRSHFKVTPRHKIFKYGMEEVAAGSLRVGDYILGRGEFVFNEDQRVLALAQVLGDGSLRKSGNRVALRVGHGWKQRDYCDWKADIFGDQVAFVETKPGERQCFDLSPSCDLHDTLDCPALISQVGLAGVAIWYLDDGSFSGSYAKWGWGKMELACKRWCHVQKEEAVTRLVRLGLPAPTITKNGFLWSGGRVQECMGKLAKYMPVCMDYKVHPKFRDRCGTYAWDEELEVRQRLLPVQIKDIQKVPSGRHSHRFDLTVENDHTYMVDGVAVHNSPETTSGGNALKFYASVRLDVRRTSVKVTNALDVVVGGEMKIKVVKNKVAPPFREVLLKIIFGKGIDRGSDILELALGMGVVEQSGSWFSFDGNRLGQGFNTAAKNIVEYDGVADAIMAEIETLESKT